MGISRFERCLSEADEEKQKFIRIVKPDHRKDRAIVDTANILENNIMLKCMGINTK
ncbi:MAG: hypothetical protein ABID61_05420 [Candidatus Micrarchaeota archaeon]